MINRLAALTVLIATLLAACASLDDSAGAATRPPQVVQRVDYGVVERIELYREGADQPTGLGAVLGGLAGGVIGHQIGSGRGNDAATVIGALGGALAGNAIEKSHDGDRYRIIVRLDDGREVILEQMGEGQLRPGDQVRIVNDRAYRV